MQIFARFDDEGLPQGFYTEEVHGARMRPIYGDVPPVTDDDPDPLAPIVGEEPNPDCKIPIDTIPIAEEVWSDFCKNQGRRKFIDGKVVVFDPPPPVPLIPQAVSKLGLIRALRESGAWATVKVAIASNEVMQEDWDAAQDIRRADPLVAAMIAAMGLTEDQVDALLIRAVALVA